MFDFFWHKNSNLVKRKTVSKAINASYAVLSSSELNLGDVYIVDINIPRMPDYGYHFVIGHGVDSSGNLYVYFDGVINATIGLMIHYCNIN